MELPIFSEERVWFPFIFSWEVIREQVKALCLFLVGILHCHDVNAVEMVYEIANEKCKVSG